MQHTVANSKLKWFLSFINADLSQLTWTDRLKLQLDMAGAFRIALDRHDFAAPINPEWNTSSLFDDTGALIDLQRQFRTILSALQKKVDNIEQGPRTREPANISPEDYLAITRLQPISLTISLTLSIEPSVLPAFTSDTEETRKTSLIGWEPSSFRIGHLDVKASSQSVEEQMIYHFLQALHDLPVESVRQCPQCGKWFVSKNLRSQLFCSSKCGTRQANKDRYYRKKTESPVEYAEELEQGKARAKKSYETRQIVICKDSPNKKLSNEDA